jgi:Xaa-Pro aminopeptidase
MTTAQVMAGVPATNRSLYRQIRFLVGDPVAFVRFGDGQRLLILRDIELERARRSAAADRFASPSDFAPAGGLSGDRETATAEALVESLRRAGVERVVVDRTMPVLFAEHLRHAGIEVRLDPEWGVRERRMKEAWEIEALAEAQETTEAAVRMACELIARAIASADGVLEHEGEILTSERVATAIDRFLLDRGFDNPPSIVAGGPQAFDCHARGSGPLRTGEPVVVDVFPRSRRTLYNGDCTRTVVHGAVPPEVARMHEAVLAAKRAAEAAVRPGATGDAVHAAAIGELAARGFSSGRPPEPTPAEWCGMTHGTGHGIGLDGHEPPLLDARGPTLVAGDAITVEPGLYCPSIGGVRVEDLVIVEAAGARNLGRLPHGLAWS